MKLEGKLNKNGSYEIQLDELEIVNGGRGSYSGGGSKKEKRSGAAVYFCTKCDTGYSFLPASGVCTCGNNEFERRA